MYSCDRCDKKFNRKSNYTRHLKRINLCHKGIFKCPNCNKQFNYKSEYRRHFKLTSLCYINYMQKKYMKLELENEKLKNQITTNNNTNYYNITNNTQNNTQNNTINQTININYFGNEDLSYITSKIIRKCLKMGTEGDINLFKTIHFHPDHPYNHNIKSENNKIEVAVGKNKSGDIIWEIKKSEEITREHVGKSYDLCLADMKSRGKDYVTEQEIECLKHRGEPTHNYIGLVKDGIIKTVN